jgi:hypothetical protein
MALYGITFLGRDEQAMHCELVECACDDDAIDRAGESQHPLAIDVHEGAAPCCAFSALAVPTSLKLNAKRRCHSDNGQ